MHVYMSNLFWHVCVYVLMCVQVYESALPREDVYVKT